MKIKNKKLYIFTLSLLFIWIMISFIEFLPIKNSIIYPIIKYIYSLTCHQISDRCFNIDENQMLFCYRCLSLYLGFLFIGILKIFYKISDKFLNLKYIVICSLPIVIDIIMEKIFNIELNNAFRFISGFIFSLPLANHFFKIISEIEIKKNEK